MARRQLEKILGSNTFASSERHQRLLKLTAERSLSGELDALKEYAIGLEVFDRSQDFDPRIDNVVRVEAHRLRARLKKYYETEGQGDQLLVEFPVGGYVPVFRRNPAAVPVEVPSTTEPAAPDRALSLPAPTLLRRLRPLLLVAAAGAVFAGWIATWRAQPVKDVAVPFRFTLLSGDNPTLGLAPLDHYPIIAISPDGRTVAYAARDGRRQLLYTRRLDQFEAVAVEGTDGATRPFFSWDGNWLGFFAQGSMKKVALGGGKPLTIAKVDGHGAAWGPNGTIVLGGNPFVGLKVLTASGSDVRDLVKVDREAGEVAHLWPRFLPDGEHILFTAWLGGGFDQTPVYLFSLRTKQRKRVAFGSSAVYADSGHLYYARDNLLLSAGFDLRGHTIGPEQPSEPGLAWGGICGVSQFAISRNGTLVYAKAGTDAGGLIYRTGADGEYKALVSERQEYHHPRLSPDGKQLAVSILSGGRYSVRIIDLSSGAARQLTPGANRNLYSVWSPDGKWLAYASDRDGPYSVYRQLADGSGLAERLTVAKAPQIPLSWAPDGSALLYAEMNETTGSDLLVLSLRGDRKVQPFQRTAFGEEAAQFSPDGKWVAYASNQSGKSEVYVSRFTKPEISWQVSTDRGWSPMWSAKGDEIVFRGRNGLLAAHASFGGKGTETPRIQKPREVLTLDMKEGVFPYLTNYDISRDGKGFIVLISESTERPSLRVVTNWSGSNGPAGTQAASRSVR